MGSCNQEAPRLVLEEAGEDAAVSSGIWGPLRSLGAQDALPRKASRSCSLSHSTASALSSRDLPNSQRPSRLGQQHDLWGQCKMKI